MKPASPQLLTFLAGNRQYFRADVYTFTLADGTILRYCGGDGDLTVNGQFFSAGGVVGPFFDTSNGTNGNWHLGVQVDTLQFDVYPGTATIGGAAFLQACRFGVFDGATMTKQRLFMPTYGDTRMGPLTIFAGRVAPLVFGRSKVQFTVNSHLELLAQSFPRNLYQPGCVNSYGDASCGVNPESFKTTGTIISATGSVIVANLTGSPVGAFNQGKIKLTSGAMSGFARTVKTATFGTPGSISLLSPFPTAPLAGVTFSIYQGCDKTFTGVNGCPKFSNTARFRGMDLIPAAEIAL